MPTYKLQYFDFRGRGELIRYIFHAAGKDFEDEICTSETWPSIKSTTPFGQIPVLHVDGKQLAQSGAISRYLAREFGLAGKDSWEQALVDQYLELAADMVKEIVHWFYEKDEEKKKELAKNLQEVVYPKYLGFFQTAIENNGRKYLVGTDLTVADLAVLDLFDTHVKENPEVMESFPKLKAHRERVASQSNLCKYIQQRTMASI